MEKIAKTDHVYSEYFKLIRQVPLVDDVVCDPGSERDRKVKVPPDSLSVDVTECADNLVADWLYLNCDDDEVELSSETADIDITAKNFQLTITDAAGKRIDGARLVLTCDLQ